MTRISPWIEAMRLRTLPVSVAGVLAGAAMAVAYGKFSLCVAIACFVFAVLAQIASNFANEYYDFVGGLDRRGREGPRRGVTEGDITPRAMIIATLATLAVACCVGLYIAFVGGWWLIAVGIAVAFGVFAYSAGPYPLSHHALGEVAVLVFFGIVPVNFTFYVMADQMEWLVFAVSIAIGLMGANVLIVNNYRDHDDDKSVGKRTLAVAFGRKAAAALYLINGLVAAAILATVLLLWKDGQASLWFLAIPAVYVVAHLRIFLMLISRDGARLNPLLGMTSVLMFAVSLAMIIAAVIA